MIPGAPHVLWLSLGVLSGTTFLDSHFADYRWNIDPRVSFGAAVEAGAGPLAAGVRVSQSRTTQTIGVPDPASAAAVHATSVELTGRVSLAKLAGFELHALASGGRLHLGYHPDHVESTVAGTPVAITLSPVDTWIGGGGLGVSRRLAGPWRAGLSVDRRFFSMDTAHRNGASIVTGPETFGDWNARFELAWLGIGMKGTS